MKSSLRLRRAAPWPADGQPGDGSPGDGSPGLRGRLLRVSVGTVLVAALVAALGGCSLLGFGDPESDPSDGKDGTTGAGAEWFWYRQGDRVVSPRAPALPATATGGATDTAVYPPAVTQPMATGRADCLTRLRANTMFWLNAVPGVGQASVSWMSFGDSRIVEYKLAAVLQNRPGGSVPPATWTRVPSPDGCQEVNATVTGLARGSWYVFWLDVVLTTAPTGRREPMIGRSPAFLVQ